MRKYQSGVSLVQTLVAGGLVSVIGVGVMNLLSNMNKSVATGKSDVEITAIHSEIRTILANPLSCEATLGGNSPNTTEGIITDIDKVLPNSGGIVQRYIVSKDKNDPNHKYGQGQIRILGYSLDDTKGEVGSSDQTTFIYTRFYRGKASKTKDIVVKSKIYYELDGSGIKTCRSIGIGDEHIWSRVDTNQNNIYYNGGRVGIGNSNPAHLFHVTQNSSFPSDNDLVFEGLKSIDMHSDIHKVNTHGGGGFWVNIFDESNNLKGEFQFKANDLLLGPVFKIKRPDTSAQVKILSGAVKFVGKDGPDRYKSNFTLEEDILKLQMLKFNENNPKKGAYFQFSHSGAFNLHGPTGNLEISSHGQAYIHLKGPAETGTSDPTRSIIYLGDENDNLHQNSWYVAHKADGRFQIGKRGGLNTDFSFMQVIEGDSVYFDPKVTVRGPLVANGEITGDTIVATGEIRGDTIVATSDIRLKENITPLENSLDKVLELNGVSYNLITQKDDRNIGLIAQDVEENFPEVVSTNHEGMKGIRYGSLIAPIIESIKSLYSFIKDDRSEIEHLKRELDQMKELKEQVQILRQEIKEIKNLREKKRVEMEKIKQVLKL